MTKKELQTLKQEYKNAIFETYHSFYKISTARTQENEISYNYKLHTEVVIERILKGLKINPEELVPENEKNYLQKIAMETATATATK